jgi:hypothetical protein
LTGEKQFENLSGQVIVFEQLDNLLACLQAIALDREVKTMSSIQRFEYKFCRLFVFPLFLLLDFNNFKSSQIIDGLQVQVHVVKNRLDPNYDAFLSAGFRFASRKLTLQNEITESKYSRK